MFLELWKKITESTNLIVVLTLWASQVAQWSRIHLPIQKMQETRVRFLDGENPPGVGNANPLQYSCLETSMDRGAWWVIVHGVAKSWKQLSSRAHRHTSQWGKMRSLFTTERQNWTERRNWTEDIFNILRILKK